MSGLQMTPNERFSRACQHLGGGNPAGGIWIVGWEEGGVWDSSETFEDHFQQIGNVSHDSLEPGDPKVEEWRISVIVSKLCNQITGLGEDWESFRAGHYLTKEGPLFVSNIYPLAKPTVASLPESYERIFGIRNPEEYRLAFAGSNRLKLVKELWNSSEPAVTICHGKGIWGKYRDIFNLTASRREEFDGMEEYDNGVFLTPHLSWAVHMPRRRIGILSERAREYWRDKQSLMFQNARPGHHQL